MTKRKTDHTWGIDRNPVSKDFGKLVVGGDGQMPIILWRVPSAKLDPDNVTGALAHNQKVDIINRTYDVSQDMAYFKVRKMVTLYGKKYPQRGWVAASLLKREGAKLYDK